MRFRPGPFRRSTPARRASEGFGGLRDLIPRLRVGSVWALLLSAILGCGRSRFERLLESANSSDLNAQKQALRELADFGGEAAPALPDLMRHMDHFDPDVRRLSGLAVANIAAATPVDQLGPQRADVIDVLTEQLADDAPAVRNSAAFGLLTLDPDHAAAQDLLRAAMLEGDGGMVDRLGRTKPPPTWAVPTLIEILDRDRRPGLRRLAAVALGEIDPEGDEVRAALQRALEDSDDRVRGVAEELLNQ